MMFLLRPQKMQLPFFLSIVTPDGMNLLMYGPLKKGRHDRFAYAQSGVYNELSSILIINGPQYSIYGNVAFVHGCYLQQGHHSANKTLLEALHDTRMLCRLVTIENMFQEHYAQFSCIDAKKALKLLIFPTEKESNVGTFLLNLRNILHPNQVVQRFNVQPPLLHKYLNQARDAHV